MDLVVKKLTKKYGEKVALREFSYTFSPGIYGAGKSTLMNLITDNVKRTEGQILWDGTDILKLGATFRKLLGYMPQQQGMYSVFSARAFLLRWFDGISKKLNPIFAGGGEARKLLIKRRGILLLILLVFLVHKMEAPPRAYVAWDPFIQFYEQKFTGPITDEKLEQMENALQNTMDEFNKKGLSIVLDAAKEAPEGAWIVPTAPYDAIWSHNEENYHRNTALMAMLILVLVLSPIASQERQNEMTVLLRSTSGGRKRLMLRKQLLLVSIAAAVWAMVYGMELFRTIEEYGGFVCLSAPAYSLPLFESGIPLWCAIGVYYAAKLMVLVIIGEASYLLSSRCTKNRDAMLLCIGFLLIPAALAAIGSGIGEYLSFLIPLGGAELLQ